MKFRLNSPRCSVANNIKDLSQFYIKMDNIKTTKILLVDDEPNILIALEFLFEKEGYIVQTAFDGHQAIQKADAFRPDIMVLDVMMPGIDGFRMIRTLSTNPDFRNMDIIVVTALGNNEIADRGGLPEDVRSP